MAGDILYGVVRVELEELDPTTDLPIEGGAKVIMDTAESVSLEAVISEGVEENKRNDKRILAIVRTPDLLYGYDVTYTENTFTPSLAALIEGGHVTIEDGEVVAYDTAMIAEGSTLKPFRLSMYVANYEGDSIKNYVVITLNKCSGTAPGFNAAKEFYAPEYTIKAREATKAGLPIKGMKYVDALPADAAPIATKTTIGTLNSAAKTITDIPTATSVTAMKAAVTTTVGAVKSIVSSTGTAVNTGDVATGQKLVVALAENGKVKTEYALTVKSGN